MSIYTVTMSEFVVFEFSVLGVMKNVLRKFGTHAAVGRRVVVTGLGMVTCLGVGTKHVWDRLLNGDCGIQKLTDKAFDQIPCKVAGVVPRGNNPGQLNLDEHVSPADQRVMSLASTYALVAADEAFNDANWRPSTVEEKQRTGVAIGMGMVGMQHIANVGQIFREKGYRHVSPYFIPMVLVNMAAGHVSLRYGLQGPNHAVSTACTTGLHAIGDAARFIQYGDADVMVAGGTEASIDPLSIAGFARMRALSTKYNSTPELASRPFDKDRDGFVMSEGAGVMILEELYHAKNRGANIYAEILGYGLSADAHHITAPSEDGTGAYNCMKNALKHADLEPESVGYVNAHATSTPLGDKAESGAIFKLFGRHCDKLLISSTKGATGHLLGAAGSLEAMLTVLACQSGKVPPTVNLNQSDTGFDLNYVFKKFSNWPDKKRIGLSNSFGFGGTNASICFSNSVGDL
ncbi:3-oxoacyl-[acyl-carrier-protein] synthase, mitochondrial-like [Mercenaria mercenaria]|uniref:3-oxoacyl-[acyl-carrier-protein] synthase, mitochondrial-like n=1 Tax=Mercenaria mercenaria TaxID=6596 RepID=UPI00234E5C96|nr:3-oxoacyl-[acyl-carrier-protein] synthase, mitochondrial-like [Mercenaria mercenaria]